MRLLLFILFCDMDCRMQVVLNLFVSQVTRAALRAPSKRRGGLWRARPYFSALWLSMDVQSCWEMATSTDAIDRPLMRDGNVMEDG